MNLADKVVVVTGGASGIGRSLAEAFAANGARGVVVADINIEWATIVADRIGALAVCCDGGDPAQIQALVDQTVAVQVIAAMQGDEPFLITPHERVRDSFRRKAEDYDGWIVRTRQRLQRMRG